MSKKKVLAGFLVYNLAVFFMWLGVMCTSLRFELAFEYYIVSYIVCLALWMLFYAFDWAMDVLVFNDE